MTLFGALSSGVSGLTAQSSAMGAISDNITNVSTVGYKNTQVDFQTLVTTQTSTTFYSAGGVQSKPRQDTGVQGLLASSTSQTDIAISGAGFFVVNEANTPTISNEFLFTRAGSFFQDNEGYLRNTAGFYLQAWPTSADGTVTPNNKSLSIPNQNVISTDYLGTVNLNRVGGTATATSTIGIGANLPSNDSTGKTHKTDVQFFDTLGNANTMSVVYTKTASDNQWNMSVSPPPDTAVLTLEDSSGVAYQSVGQLEFTDKPNEGATVTIEGITYEFSADATVNGTNTRVTTTASSTTAVDVAALVAAVIAKDSDFDTTNNRIQVNPGVTTSVLFTEDGTRDIAIDPSGLLNSSGSRAAKQESAFSVRKTGATYRDYEQFTFSGVPATASTIAIAGTTFTIADGENPDTSGTDTTVARQTTVSSADLGTLTWDTTTITSTGTPWANVQVGDLITFSADNTATYTVASVDATGASIVVQTALSVNGGATNAVATGTGVYLNNILTDLENAIEGQLADFAAGSNTARIRTNNRSGGTAADTSANTLILSNLTSAYNITPTAAFLPTEPDGTVTYSNATPFTIDKIQAITFDSDGLPSSINVAEVEILNFENGAAAMNDDASQANQITLDFGTIGEANGMTQFGAEFTPVFITQNGSQFGTFAGVTISTSGLVTALFDNGETRNVYQLPIATFTNVNSLGNKTGNVWNSTEASGDPTLRTPDNGPAGAIVQSALEQSTVDIGAEFTKMIVVQRAFSAAAKIISTADEMLEELLRTKR